MAVVDANYRFLYVNVGAQGRIGDAGVFSDCKLFLVLESNALGLPPSCTLPQSDVGCPCMLVGDTAFPVKSYLIKPFHRRGLVNKEIIFNYRLSRARRVVERWRTRLEFSQVGFRRESRCWSRRNVRSQQQCFAVICGPMWRTDGVRIDVEDVSTGVVARGTWRDSSTDLRLKQLQQHGSRCPADAEVVRNDLSQYFMDRWSSAMAVASDEQQVTATTRQLMRDVFCSNVDISFFLLDCATVNNTFWDNKISQKYSVTGKI